nr:tRNA pseudouridine synthase-like 1 isoform X2 [Maniola hyperantus]
MKARYLTFFSYIGTKFRSSEKLWLKEGRNYPDPESVQGLMELALLKIRPLNYPNLTLSSRTDGGVHALNSSAHVDLERKGATIYETHYVTYEMNKFFFKNDISIFVRKFLRVNDNFSARFNALSRTYLYRHQEFDIERFKEGAKHLEGYHDFTTFKKFDKLLQYKHNRREIKSIVVSPGRPCTVGYSTGIENCFNYWDIEIRGKAFVHNQIRRMIGTLISVAVGKLEPGDVKVMLQVPSKHSWHTFIQNCPPDGLYLCNVEYNPEDLVYDPEKNMTNVSEDIESESEV